MSTYYLTTTIPYVNAEPHIGMALELIQADVLARFHRIMGEDVIFNFGTDEHGQKIYQKAVEQGRTPQEYCDEFSAKFELLKDALHLSYTNFIRTTDEHHKNAAQKFWMMCKENGDIYKKFYTIKYCVGCELEKTDSELENGKCPLHPNLDIQKYEEENYFFKFSTYQQQLLELYKNNPHFVVPTAKLNEIRNFVEAGLQDFSISRLKSKMPWGIDVPDDNEHVMYVWFDALINYISTIGWPEDKEQFEKYWPVHQFAGKDQVRQQAAMWQAMLFSAKLPNSKQIFIHGFMTVDGQKISKSLGNTIDPIAVTQEYGVDALRYYLLAKIHPWEDSDFSWDKFRESYNADLANGLGNLVARVAKLCENSGYEQLISQNKASTHLIHIEGYADALHEYRFNDALFFVWEKIRELDKFISDERPWELVNKDTTRLREILSHAVDHIQEISVLLEPFLPQTAQKIQEQFAQAKIVSSTPLFPRLTPQKS